MDGIKVSVICNTYNHGKYVRDALEGFVKQRTNFPFEVLVHDDASTDNTQEIICEYEQAYPDLIKPIYQSENQYSQRIPITRTYQLPRTCGKYIALCEGDDYWTDPQKLQKQYDFMESHPDFTLCTCSTRWLNLKTMKFEKRGYVQKDREFTLEELLLEKQGRCFQAASYFIKSEVEKDFPEWRKMFPIGDYPLTVLAAMRGRVYMLADCMCVYRFFSDGSWTARMHSVEQRVSINNRRIAAMKALNAETNYRYDALINKKIRMHEYTNALITRDLKAVLSEHLRDIFKSRSALHKAADIARCLFPNIFSLISVLVKGESSIR